MTTVVVTGGRDVYDWRLAWAALSTLDEVEPITRLWHGRASGWDTSCRLWAHAMNACGRRIVIRCVAARWEVFQQRAGFMRNGRMLFMAMRQPVRCVVAGPGGNGTADCIKSAKALGFKVKRIRA